MEKNVTKCTSAVSPTTIVLAAQKGVSYKIKRVKLWARLIATDNTTSVNFNFTPADSTLYATTVSIKLPTVPGVAGVYQLADDQVNIVTKSNVIVSVGVSGGAATDYGWYVEYEEIKGIAQRDD